MRLFIKYMVCDRCKSIVIDAVNKIGIAYDKVRLGELYISQNISDRQFTELKDMLKKSGLVLLDNRQNAIVEKLLNRINDKVNFPGHGKDKILSDFINPAHNRYSGFLNLLFSDIECLSIDRYIEELKISKIKKMLSCNELSITQIASIMNYKSKAQFYGHFKSCTGLYPAYFKQWRSHLPYNHSFN